MKKMDLAASFITAEDDGKDLIVSFAVPDEALIVVSLILMRTPLFEHILDEEERGVSVSMEGREEAGKLRKVSVGADCVVIEAENESYRLDISKVDGSEMKHMKRVLKKMNFDKSFAVQGL